MNLAKPRNRRNRIAPLKAPSQIGFLLSKGIPVPDSLFDSIYPDCVSRLSTIHWTPVRVAMAASIFLQKYGSKHVLDVGSGCGKFCLVGALTSNLHFYGAEQRSWLNDAAVEAGKMLKATRATFFHGNALEMDWQSYDAIYFFNPFYEHKEPSIRIDQTIPMGEAQFESIVLAVIEKLRDQKRGTVVATYHGVGGQLSEKYQLIDTLPCGTLPLEIWQRR